ncbi:hypothetical protein [Methylobacterium sp. Leaf118]|uniref:hypothetical protein n=1 Tax=Methylobacterium sp. Leaf118 TaxID=2876562 RepID=UPI001E5273F0|nr:hypothetical protein [Methylobacterium sp. Leaf118]
MGRRQQPGEARTAKAGFAEMVLVCRKCAKRQGVDRKRLGRALKRAAAREAGDGARVAGARKGAGRVKVVATGCLGPCPKRMLTVATPASLARARVFLLDPALDALGPHTLRLDAPAPPASDV